MINCLKLFFSALFCVVLSWPAQAATTFLPDYDDSSPEFTIEALCSRAVKSGGGALYHYSTTKPQCPEPKIFDETCPHDKNWISECYCPHTYTETCNSPYRGVGLICDGKYESCCDTRCPAGDTYGCYGSYITDYTTTTGCGDTCYVCRIKNTCNTSCGAGEDAIASGGTNDDNGQACVRCETPAPDPTIDCTGCECDNSCPPSTPDEPDTPSCNDTCASKGYSSTSGGKDCSTTTVCGSTCYYSCKEREPDDPCKGVNCSDGKTCQNGSCVCPSGQCCPSCNSSQVCDGGKCRAKTCSEKGMKDCNGTCISSSGCCSNSDCPGDQTCENHSCKAPACKYEDKCSGYTLSSDSSCPCHGTSCSACGVTKYKCLPACKIGYTCDYSQSRDCFIRPAKTIYQPNNRNCAKCECDNRGCVTSSGKACQCQFF